MKAIVPAHRATKSHVPDASSADYTRAPATRTLGDQFFSNRKLVEEEVGFPLSKGTSVDYDYEKKVLGGMLAALRRWNRRWEKDGIPIDLEEIVDLFFKDKKLQGHLRRLIERKFANVQFGAVRVFIPIHPEDTHKPLVKAVFEQAISKLFSFEQQKILERVSFVLVWVGSKPSRQTSTFLLQSKK